MKQMILSVLAVVTVAVLILAVPAEVFAMAKKPPVGTYTRCIYDVQVKHNIKGWYTTPEADKDYNVCSCKYYGRPLTINGVCA